MQCYHMSISDLKAESPKSRTSRVVSGDACVLPTGQNRQAGLDCQACGRWDVFLLGQPGVPTRYLLGYVDGCMLHRHCSEVGPGGCVTARRVVKEVKKRKERKKGEKKKTP